MRKKAFVDKNRCVACGACAVACPREAIAVHKGGYAVVDGDKCIGCGLCAKACPACCIEVKEREPNED